MKNKELIELINNYKPKYLYRRKDGCIDKFEVINENTVLHLQTGVTTNLDEIILLGKISENIIDLIEEGDYVNGKLIHKVDIRENSAYIYYGNGKAFCDSQIKDVVTKEQFNQMKYIVGDESSVKD